MNPTDTPPTVAEELARKTVDLLTEHVHLNGSGRLSGPDLALVGSVLWSVTAGLVPDDVSDLCAKVAGEGKNKPIKRHFIQHSTVRTVAWFSHRPGYVVITRHAETGYDMAHADTRKCETEIDRRYAELETLFAALRKAGYVEL